MTTQTETWEQKRDREKAEKIAEYRRFASGVGGKVDIDREYGTAQRVRFTVSDNGTDIAFSADLVWNKPRWSIAPELPKDWKHSGERPSITCDKARGADAILRDIRSRLLADSREWLAKCQEATQSRDEYTKATHDTFAALESGCKARGLKFQAGREDDPHCRAAWVGSAMLRVQGTSIYAERLTWKNPDACAAALEGIER